MVASGTLAAVSTVKVGSPVPGQVLEIFADFNTRVKKDQVIARIDPQGFELRVNQARADLDAARNTAAVAASALAAQRAEAGRIKASLAEAEAELGRKKALAEKKFISPAELEKARARCDTVREQLSSAEAQLVQSEAQVAGTQAAVKPREGLLRQAQADLEHTVIRAPADGTVILKNIDAGQTIAAGPQAPVLFSIAPDLRDMLIEAAMGEDDAGRLRTGMAVNFTVDAFQRRTFSGEVRQIRRSPASAQNAAGYMAVISTANPDQSLLPGMSANLRVIVDSRDNVLKLPNAALRAHPDAGRPAAGRAWVPGPDGQPSPVDLRIGLTDGRSTEIVAGPLKEGDEVILGASESPAMVTP